MAETEGVAKYQLTFTEKAPLSEKELAEINAWRRILHMTDLIGQDPLRYGGYGFGNISQRHCQAHPKGSEQHFIISGSQTGNLPDLAPWHYALVTQWDPEKNQVKAEGPIRPSSEALTHGVLYAADSRIHAVVHAHSQPIWQQARVLGLPATPKTAEFGTPEMALAISDLHGEVWESAGIFVMAGHTDGVVAFGENLEGACLLLLKALARAMASPRQPDITLRLYPYLR